MKKREDIYKDYKEVIRLYRDELLQRIMNEKYNYKYLENGEIKCLKNI